MSKSLCQSEFPVHDKQEPVVYSVFCNLERGGVHVRAIARHSTKVSYRIYLVGNYALHTCTILLHLSHSRCSTSPGCEMSVVQNPSVFWHHKQHTTTLPRTSRRGAYSIAARQVSFSHWSWSEDRSLVQFSAPTLCTHHRDTSTTFTGKHPTMFPVACSSSFPAFLHTTGALTRVFSNKKLKTSGL